MRELQTFYEQLMSDVVAEAAPLVSESGKNPDFKETAFIKLVLADLEGAGAVEEPTACFWASSSARLPFKVNGFGFPDEDQRLDVVVADFRTGDSPARLTGADVDRSFRHLLRFVSIAVAGDHLDALDPGSEEELAMLKEIFARRKLFDKIQLILVTNGEVVQRKEKERKGKLGPYALSYEIWDLERLRRFRSSGATHEPITVDFRDLSGGGIRCVPVADSDLGYRTCVAVIPGRVLAALYEGYGSRLLELNVRSYLQARGKINKEILETLLTRPKLFLAYNNGITIVAEGMDLDEKTGTIAEISGLQIVNGGQTTASIHRAQKENDASLEHVFVQAKITVVPVESFEEMVPEISRLSNTQNRVSAVDLKANNAYHVGIERVATRTWTPGEQSMWFYERARGAFQTQRSSVGASAPKKAAFDRRYPAAQRIVKEDLARYSNAWDGLPHVVSKGGQKSFERFMRNLTPVQKGWEPTQDEYKTLIGKAILFRCAQEVAKRLGIRAFAINIVTYAVALLAERTARRVHLVTLWNRQGLTHALSEQFEDWLPRVEKQLLASTGARNPGEWFKVEDCWNQLKDASKGWALSDQLSAELNSVGEDYRDVPDSVQSDAAHCMSLEPREWLEVQLWGQSSGELQSWQIGIANTLSGYAAQGWKRKPSEKQAKHGVAIIELFRRAHRDRSA